MSSSTPPSRPTSALTRSDLTESSIERPSTAYATHHHQSIVQLLRDRKREHVDASLWANSSSTTNYRSSSKKPPVDANVSIVKLPPRSSHLHHATAQQNNFWFQHRDPAAHHQDGVDDNHAASASTSTSSSSQAMRGASISTLMEECRRRKLSRFRFDSLNEAELQYRERIERSWLQGVWFLWQRLLPPLLEHGLKNAVVRKRMTSANSKLRQRNLKASLARSLEKLSQITHLTLRMGAWKMYVIARKHRQHRTFQASSPLQATIAAREQNTQTTGEGLLDELIRQDDTEEEPSLNVSPVRQGHQLHHNHAEEEEEENRYATVAVVSAVVGQSPPTASGTGGRGSTSHPTTPPVYRGYAMEDPWSPSLSSQPQSTQGLTSSRLSELSATTHTFLQQQQQHRSEDKTVDVFAVLAVQSFASDLFQRHVAKLQKICMREEDLHRQFLKRSIEQFVLQRNINFLTSLMHARSTAYLRQHQVKLFEFLEHSARTIQLIEESTVVVDLIVDYKVGVKELLRAGGGGAYQVLPSAGSNQTKQLANIPSRVAEGLVMLTEATARHIQRLGRSLQNRVRLGQVYQQQKTVHAAAAKAKRLTAVTIIQRVSRGLTQRKQLGVVLSFWKIDRAVRREAWEAFSKSLIILAGHLAADLHHEEHHARHAKHQKDVQALNAVLQIQRCGRGCDTRAKMQQHHVFWQMDTEIRKNVLDAWLTRWNHVVTVVEPQRRLLCQARAAITTSGNNALVELRDLCMAHREGSQRVSHSEETLALTLQRIGRGRAIRRHLEMMWMFWKTDRVVRAELYGGWLSLATQIRCVREPRGRVGVVDTERRRRIEQRESNERQELLHDLQCKLYEEQQRTSPDNNENVVREERGSCPGANPITTNACLLLQRVFRGSKQRSVAKKLWLFWKVDATIREETFNGWYRRAHVVMKIAAPKARLNISEGNTRHAIVDEQNQCWQAIMSQTISTSCRILQRAGRGYMLRRSCFRDSLFWQADRDIRKEAFLAWMTKAVHLYKKHQHAVMNKQEADVRQCIESEEHRTVSELDEANRLYLQQPKKSTSPISAPLDAPPNVVKSAVPIAADHSDSDVDVSDESEPEDKEERSSSSKRQKLSKQTESQVVALPAIAGEVTAPSSPHRSNSTVTVSDDEEDDDATVVVLSSSDEVDNDTENVDENGEEVDVSSNDEPEPSKPVVLFEEEQNQKSSQKPQKAVGRFRDNDDHEGSDVDVSSDEDVQKVQPPLNSMYAVLHEDSSSDDDEEISTDVSSSDAGAISADTAVQMTSHLLPEAFGEARLIVEQEAAQWGHLVRMHTSEMAALVDDDVSSSSSSVSVSDKNDDDDDRSLHFAETPQQRALLTPARSDTTHVPHLYGSLNNNNNGSMEKSDSVGALMTQSSSATVTRANLSEKEDNVEVASSSTEKSIDVSSDDDSEYQHRNSNVTGPPPERQSSIPVMRRTASVKEVYDKIFREQRQKLETQELVARATIDKDLVRIQTSLLMAEEYLVRYSVIVPSRNRFARNMLDTKQKLIDMVKMQLKKDSSTLTSATVKNAALPPRGSIARTHKREGSSNSVSSAGGTSPNSTDFSPMIRAPNSPSVLFRKVSEAIAGEPSTCDEEEELVSH